MHRVTFAAIGLILGHFGAVEAAQDTWKPITGGGMSITAPCAGDWNTSKQDVPEEASVITTNVLACKTAEAFVVIVWSEVVTKRRFDGMLALRSGRDAMLKRAGDGQLVTSADIEHDGLQGIEFTANLRGTTLLSNRSVFHGKRMYQITIGTPLDQDRSADITRLMTSLKVAR